MRFKIIHFHIFKNAGTSIQDLLQRNFEDAYIDFDKLGLNDHEEPRQTIFNRIASHPDMLAGSSHMHFYPLPEIPECRLIDLTFFRHPVDRLFSMYNFLSKDKGNQQEYFKYGNTFESFLENMFSSRPFDSISAQTTFMASGGEYYFPASTEQRNAAIRKVRKVRFLGTVDQFNKSVQTGCHFLRPIFPHIKPVYSVNKERHITRGAESFSG